MSTQLLSAWSHEGATRHTRDTGATPQLASVDADNPIHDGDTYDYDDHDDVPPVPDYLIPVLEAIQTITNDEIDAILAALRNRDNELREQRAEHATVGRRIVISDILPRYLDGLVGDIEHSDGDWVSVRLTAESTGRLRFCGQPDYDTGAELRFLITGVPASLCFEPDTA